MGNVIRLLIAFAVLGVALIYQYASAGDIEDINPVDTSAPGGEAVKDIDLNGVYSVFGDADGNTTISATTNDVWSITSGGTQRVTIGNSGVTGTSYLYGTSGVGSAAAGVFYFNTRSRMYSPVNGAVTLTNAAGTAGIYLDFATADTLSIANLTGDYASKATLIITGVKGATSTSTTATEVLTFAANPGDASKTTSSLIPDGSWLEGITTRVVTAGTNCTSIDIGDGSDIDIFGDNKSVADASLTTNADATASFSNPALAAANVTVTGVGGNCFDLSIRVTAHYKTFGAATSD